MFQILMFYLRCCVAFLNKFTKFTSRSNSLEIVSVRVRDIISRLSLLGAVVQLTHLCGNDIVDALTFDVIVTSLKAFK